MSLAKLLQQDSEGDATGGDGGAEVDGDCTGTRGTDDGGDGEPGDDWAHHGAKPHVGTAEVLGVTALPETGAGMGEPGGAWLLFAGLSLLLAMAGIGLQIRRRSV